MVWQVSYHLVMTDMTVIEAAAAAGVSERTMRRWIREGRLAGCYKVGGRVRVPNQAIREAAEPYGNPAAPQAVANLIAFLNDPERAAAARRRRFEIAFAEVDEIRKRGRPSSGPDDTAEAYVRQGRDELDAKWDRLLGFGDDDPRR